MFYDVEYANESSRLHFQERGGNMCKRPKTDRKGWLWGAKL
jgi:hypothetical protein